MNDRKNVLEDVDEGIDFNEEAFKKRFRPIARPKSLDQALGKSRITTFMDADIVDHFKKLAEKEGKGYQTLINQALRQIVDAERKKVEKEELKKELLTDKKFLQELKTALSV